MSGRDAAAVRFPPPLIFLGFLLLGLLIDRLLSLPTLAISWIPGAAVALIGAALIAVAVGAFRRAGEDPQPWTATEQIVATGLYRRSRNPMYLGMAIVTFGLALALASMTALLLAMLAVSVVSRTVIAREEAYLAGKFGATYRAYCARTRRWL